MIEQYLPIFIVLAVALGFAFAVVAVAVLAVAAHDVERAAREGLRHLLQYPNQPRIGQLHAR